MKSCLYLQYRSVEIFEDVMFTSINRVSGTSCSGHDDVLFFFFHMMSLRRHQNSGVFFINVFNDLIDFIDSRITCGHLVLVYDRESTDTSTADLPDCAELCIVSG